MIPILQFTPYFKSVIWGGERIARFKGIPSQGSDIGESWEISPMDAHQSEVADGPFKGETLNSLVARFPDEILGKKVNARWRGRFPLLVKFIDSNDDLSIQVHPDDALAAKRHDGQLGKTEMWYSVDPSEGAYLYAGFNCPVTPRLVRAMIEGKTIVDALGKFYVEAGDTFFLPAGCVHAIGKGNFVVEIQEASDITYRMYDYDRPGTDGKPRQLHIEEALEAIDYDAPASTKRNISPKAAGETEIVNECEYFTTSVTDIDGVLNLDLSQRDSFTVLICINGSLTVTGDDGQPISLPQGHTLLVPASIPSITLSGKGRLLSTHV